MLAIIGIVVVFAAVLGGYLLERGNPYVLMQPAELLIVGGAAAGIILVANPPAVIRKMRHGVAVVLRAPRHTRESFLRHLLMLFEVFAYSQKAGIVSLESDVENPPQSRIFSRYPGFLQDEATRNFVRDSLRMLVIGATSSQNTADPTASRAGEECVCESSRFGNLARPIRLHLGAAGAPNGGAGVPGKWPMRTSSPR